MPPLKGQRTGRGAHTIGSVDVVFQQNRDAMQRATDLALLALAIERIGERFRFRIEFDNGAEPRAVAVEVMNASRVEFQEAPRCPTTRSKPLADVADPQLIQFK